MSEVIPLAALTSVQSRWWRDPYGVLLRSSIVVGWLPGFTLGLVLMLELALLQRIGMGWWPHAQTHAHAQIYGFGGLFFFGVATQILPRFLGHALVGRSLVSVGGLLLGGSFIARLSVQPFPPGAVRDSLLSIVAWVGLIGAVAIATAFVRTALSTRRREHWQIFLGLGLLSWTAGSIASFWSTIVLASGHLLIPHPIHELTLHLGLWGFIVPVTLAVGVRVFPNLLLLRPGSTRGQTVGLAVYAVGTWLVATTWIAEVVLTDVGAQSQPIRLLGWLLMAGGGLVIVWSLRIFEPAERVSSAPGVTNPTRLWFRLAIGYMLVALFTGAFLEGREVIAGVAASATEVSAARHALTMGYLTPLIIGMAGRILPEISGEMARRPRILAAMMWLILGGAGLRVVGEIWGGYSGPGTTLMVIGAITAFVAFGWFSARLWISIGRRPVGTYGV